MDCLSAFMIDLFYEDLSEPQAIFLYLRVRPHIAVTKNSGLLQNYLQKTAVR